MNILPLQTDFFKRCVDAYLMAWETIDHRVDGLPLMSSIKPVVILFMLYMAMVVAGPRYMSTRRAYKLTWIMGLYNGTMSLVNLYIVIQVAIAISRLDYDLLCEIPHPEATDVEEMRMVNAIYVYFLTKPIEWLDTFFFIVRKKHNQLTFLHVYHHATIFLFTWVCTRWVPSGGTFFPIFFNSLVHFVMYGYYGLTVLGPRIQKYLWWKKYLTIFQMIQFMALMLQGLNGLIIGCEFIKCIQYMIIFYMCSFLVLFGLFYRNTYSVKLHLKMK